MHSYAEIDGVPSAADHTLLTSVLRDRWGFAGTVVADYFGIRFLQTLHGVAGDRGRGRRAGARGRRRRRAAERALLRRAAARTRWPGGDVDEALVDRALRRVLTQKAELGLLDADWSPRADPDLDLDDEPSRDVALRLARESIVLLANRGGPCRCGPARGSRSSAPSPTTRWRCSAATRSPRTSACTTRSTGSASRSRRSSTRCASAHAGRHLRPRLRRRPTPTAPGSPRPSPPPGDADVCVVAVGDRAGLFGRGTSGEGCDATDLHLPGVQADLVRALLDTGTPVVLVLLTGRPVRRRPARRRRRPRSCRRSSPASSAGRRSRRC